MRSLAIALLAAAPALAQPVTIEDRGASVTFPLGAASFVDAARIDAVGDPAPGEAASRPNAMTGPPDYSDEATSLTLGCRGSAIARFDDNVLVDVDGPDLYVFEVGPDVEPTEVEVSEDGLSWIALGTIGGGTASLDMAGLVTESATFRFVRLTDIGRACSGSWPGADIDAIGAIGALPREEAPEAVAYDDGKGGTVTFDYGELSFADAVTDYAPASGIRDEDAMDPHSVLGVPDYDGGARTGFTTLGCGGIGTWRFEDNVLIDVDGPDLFIFEIGPDVEGMSVAISPDGAAWTEVGEVRGATSSIDIGPYAVPGEAYLHVRLTDDGRACSGDWPGADIDAIGALGTGRRIVLDASVLFDVASAELRDEALEALGLLLDRMGTRQDWRVVVQGHTDADGSDAYNLGLSEARAGAVAGWLRAFGPETIAPEAVGYGEARPTSSNATEAGKALNRRVEILLIAR